MLYFHLCKIYLFIFLFIYLLSFSFFFSYLIGSCWDFASTSAGKIYIDFFICFYIHLFFFFIDFILPFIYLFATNFFFLYHIQSLIVSLSLETTLGLLSFYPLKSFLTVDMVEAAVVVTLEVSLRVFTNTVSPMRLAKPMLENPTTTVILNMSVLLALPLVSALLFPTTLLTM